MFLASYRYTEAGAYRIAEAEREKPRREALIEVSRRWEEQQARKRQAEEARLRRLADSAAERRRQMSDDRPSIFVLRDIIDLVARMHGARYVDVMGDSREDRIVTARQAAICAVAYKRPDMSLPRLGRLFGRDHTTILYTLRVRGFR
jgi:chromosomal replication initiation ATPase DnaA